MSITYAVINQKGGVGKTTTAWALAAGLSLRGHKVLTIDMDAQGNLTYTAGADRKRPTILGVLVREVSIEDAIQTTAAGDFVPSSPSLVGADAIITETGKEYRLRDALDQVRDRYDYIVLDTPPALGILTVNALTACDKCIIPCQADIYSIQGLSSLSETIAPVRKYCNAALRIDGILLTRYNPRTVLSRDVRDMMDEISEQMDTRVYQTTIREATAIKEAQISRQTIFQYAPRSNVAQDYSEFIDEILGGQ